MKILDWLKLDELKTSPDLDSASTSEIHAAIIGKKAFLKKLYGEYYNEFLKAFQNRIDGLKLVEIGSGGGFLKRIVPSVVTSDVVSLPGIDLCFSAEKMPFPDGSIDGFFAMNVLHHIPEPRLFLNEINRCLKRGGKLVMVEPAVTGWSRFVYQNFHHEPFDPKGDWKIEGTGRLSGANGALPWIIFCRDAKVFQKEYPKLKLNRLKNHTPLKYLISGGLTLKQLLPDFCYGLIDGLEKGLSPFNNYIGMFMTIEIEKIG